MPGPVSRKHRTTSPAGLWFVFFAFPLVFLSCVTLSPVDSAPEKPVTADAPESVVPQWRPLAADHSGAAAWFAGKTGKPRLEFRALRLDLAAPGLQIVVRGGLAGQNSGKTLSTKVSSFVRDNGLLAGINATPFDPASAREGEPRTNAGIVVSGGTLVSPPNPRFDALVWYADGGPAIVPQAGLRSVLDTSPGSILHAAGGFHRILENSALTQRALDSKPRYARSAAGLSPRGRFLYLLVIDGSRPGSPGATEAETALLLRALGASEGLNLDGGGSSALALRYPGGAVRTANIPAHGGIPGQERAVAACLGAAITGGASGEK